MRIFTNVGWLRNVCLLGNSCNLVQGLYETKTGGHFYDTKGDRFENLQEANERRLSSNPLDTWPSLIDPQKSGEGMIFDIFDKKKVNQ